MSPDSSLRFTEAELAMLAKTADALTAYLGKAVLAGAGIAENGHEWVAFARPLEAGAEPDPDDIHMQMGGQNMRWVGSKGGLNPGPDDIYECVYLWAIQLSPVEGERFVKLDHQGEEFGWSDDLADLLPFGLGELEPAPDDDEDEDTPEE